MSDQSITRRYTKVEIAELIKKLAEEIGRTPTLKELRAKKGVTQKAIVKFFGNYRRALQDCGVEVFGPGHKVDMATLFAEWAGLVRKLGKLPTVAEFEIHSRYTCRSPLQRFGQWSKVPVGLVQYAEETGIAAGWEDVIEIVKRKYPGGMKRASTSTTVDALTLKPKVHPGRRFYGECISKCLLAFAPTNEMGVIALFCSMAIQMGFVILWIGGPFPDCEAMREVEPGRWQTVVIEFEFEARSFLAHGHDPGKCDMLVCWENDWPGCPLEVLELKPLFFAVKGGGGKA